MDTIKINKKETLMIAHRGVSEIEVENTLASFRLAISKSYYGVETDVHVTKDNKFIISHDNNTLRVSGIDKVISESTFEEIHSIRIYDKDGTYNKNQYFPSLEEYIEIIKEGNKVAVLELKGEMNEENLKDILAIIKNYDYLDKMVFISFSLNNLISCQKLYKEGKYQYLNDIKTLKDKKKVISEAKKYGFDVDVNHKYLTKRFIDKCHKENIKVNSFTINDEEEAQKFIEMGLDYITSNILE